MSMTISEIRERKESAEQEITKIIDRFKQDTKVIVTSIHREVVETVDCFGITELNTLTFRISVSIDL